MGYIVSVMFGAVIGFIICSALTAGKISDLQDKIFKLRKENYRLNTTVK